MLIFIPYGCNISFYGTDFAEDLSEVNIFLHYTYEAILMINGMLFVVSAASGAGKTSLVKVLVGSMSNIKMSTSHTTREKRSKEQDGVDYHFVSQDEFKQLIKKEAFIEYAEVFGNYYGTTKQSVIAMLNQGIDVILEIDWQGAKQVRQSFPESQSIFILPPSVQVLEERLGTRGQDNIAVIEKRMAQSKNEMLHYDEFDFVIINDIFDTALAHMKSIIETSRLRCSVQSMAHFDLISALLK